MLYFPKTQFLSHSYSGNGNTGSTFVPSTLSLLSSSVLGSLLERCSCSSALSTTSLGPSSAHLASAWFSGSGSPPAGHSVSGTQLGNMSRMWRRLRSRLPHRHGTEIGLRLHSTGSCRAQGNHWSDRRVALCWGIVRTNRCGQGLTSAASAVRLRNFLFDEVGRTIGNGCVRG